MKNFAHYITLIGWVIFSIPLYAGTTLVIDDVFYQKQLNSWYELKDHLQVLDAPFHAVQPGEISNPALRWRFLKENEPFTWRNQAWMKLQIRNDRPLPSSLVLLLHADDWQVFYVQNNELLEGPTGGNLRPSSSWDSNHHRPIFASPHTIQFDVAANNTETLWIKLGINDQGLRLRPKLTNRTHFLDYSTQYFNRTFISQSFFHGMLWMILLYHLLIFLMNRDWSYLYYTLYIIAISISLFFHFGMHHFTMIAEYPTLARLLPIIGIYAHSFCYTHFLICFLHREHWMPALQRLMVKFSWFVVIAGFTHIGTLLLPPAYFRVVDSYWFLLPLAVSGLLGLGFISWRYWYSEHKLARFIAANNLFMLIGLLVSAIVYYLGSLDWLDLLPTSFWGILGLELMIILQLLSFSLSLSYKGLEIERERVKLKELDTLKSNFFARISHEFRTPLTLILGPIQQLKAIINQSNSRNRLLMAERHAKQLLQMVNQILDLSKLEAGKLTLDLQPFDIIEYIQVITLSFESIAQEKAIEMAFQANKPNCKVLLDKAKIEQILVNLIGNAVKYNKSNGRIDVNVLVLDNQRLTIEVSDTGIGISAADLPQIFQLYYRGQHQDLSNDLDRTGIGLAHTKELVELHQGTIEVKSQSQLGTTFTVHIPLSTVDQGESISKEVSPDEKLEKGTRKDERSLVLLVEDHLDMQTYIESCLQASFEVVTAKNGRDGLNTARRVVPDLIITDVMMPKMDGFSLTKALKEDEITSHIPVIILTGKSAQVSRVQGIKSQADLYLTKPFDQEELLLQVQNLLQNRLKWTNYFKKSANLKDTDVHTPSMETVFLSKVDQAIEQNIGNSEYSVERLGRDLNLDRSQLFRKIKAITGQSPSQYIRAYRLLRAYQLLQKRSGTVSEIALEVGFNSTSYFNRTFKEQFQKTPGEVLKEI